MGVLHGIIKSLLPGIIYDRFHAAQRVTGNRDSSTGGSDRLQSSIDPAFVHLHPQGRLTKGYVRAVYLQVVVLLEVLQNAPR